MGVYPFYSNIKREGIDLFEDVIKALYDELTNLWWNDPSYIVDIYVFIKRSLLKRKAKNNM